MVELASRRLRYLLSLWNRYWILFDGVELVVELPEQVLDRRLIIVQAALDLSRLS